MRFKAVLLRSKSNIVSTKGGRGEATAAAIHCVFQLTGAQSWGAPGTGGAGEASSKCGSSVSSVCEHMAGVCCSLVFSLPI